MNTAIDYIKDKNANTIPELYPVSETDILELQKHLVIPEDILNIWHECGYGFFGKRKDYDKMPGGYFFMDASEMLDAITDDYFIEEDILEAGLPFFKLFDLVYTVKF